jgi:hypothetical protein
MKNRNLDQRYVPFSEEYRVEINPILFVISVPL